MFFLGIDIGSAATKIVVIDEDENIVDGSIVNMGTGTSNVDDSVDELLKRNGIDRSACPFTVATGYGRMNYKGAQMQMSEITCHAKGVHKVLPEVHTIIDIGGQDSKVIRIDDQGLILEFAMNDKCAAGTGRFLEVMSNVLGTNISQLGSLGEGASEILPISNTCTVFAESEVISRLSEGKNIPDIVAGIHESVAKRVTGLVLRVGIHPETALTGGVAKNIGIIKALEKELKIKLSIADKPQLTGALGAAMMAREKYFNDLNSR